MGLQRAPSGPLRLFVQLLWYSDEGARPDGAGREHVLPTGAMHLVLRLTEDPLRVFGGVDDALGQPIGTSVIGGARAAFYVRDVSQASCSVGALLHPGASLPLFGVPAEALAGRHTALDDVWGREAQELRERLLEIASPHDRLASFEAALAARLPRVRGVHPVVAHALQRFDAAASEIGEVVRDTGYSHRRFITLFRDSVGLSPKRYCRVLRLQRALARLARGLRPSDVAHAAGYSDQAHLTREFQALAGLTPGQFLRLAPRHSHHVPIAAAGSNPFKTRAAPRTKVDPS